MGGRMSEETTKKPLRNEKVVEESNRHRWIESEKSRARYRRSSGPPPTGWNESGGGGWIIII